MQRKLTFGRHRWARIAIVSGGFAILLVGAFPGVGSDEPASNLPSKPTKANYELAARWTSSNVAKLVFDMAVTPHWLADGNRFWYTYENNAGRKFYVVDPVKKTKTYVFDAVKLAASLAGIHGKPVVIYPRKRHTGLLELLSGSNDSETAIQRILSRRTPTFLYRW